VNKNKKKGQRVVLQGLGKEKNPKTTFFLKSRKESRMGNRAGEKKERNNHSLKKGLSSGGLLKKGIKSEDPKNERVQKHLCGSFL